MNKMLSDFTIGYPFLIAVTAFLILIGLISVGLEKLESTNFDINLLGIHKIFAV